MLLSVHICTVFASEPATPLTGKHEIQTFLAELTAQMGDVDSLLKSKPKKHDVRDVLLASFLVKVKGATGHTQYKLDSKPYFLSSKSFVLSLELRGNETISGPRLKELKRTFDPYMEFLLQNIKFYQKRLNILNRKAASKKKMRDLDRLKARSKYAKDLTGKVLLIMERPEAKLKALEGIYMQLWRDGDAYPGGTAGALIKEANEGRDLKHFSKAKDRASQLKGLIKEQARFMSDEELKTARNVLEDLYLALRIAMEKGAE